MRAGTGREVVICPPFDLQANSLVGTETPLYVPIPIHGLSERKIMLLNKSPNFFNSARNRGLCLMGFPNHPSPYLEVELGEGGNTEDFDQLK